MIIQLWHLLAAFVLGLFIGTNLGVFLMCTMRVAGRRDDP